LPGKTGVIIEIGDMVTRFIPLGILADEAGDIGLVSAGKFRLGIEEGIEIAGKSFTPAVKIDEAVDILRGKEAILPGIRLCKMIRHGSWVERNVPRAVHHGTHETGG